MGWVEDKTVDPERAVTAMLCVAEHTHTAFCIPHCIQHCAVDVALHTHVVDIIPLCNSTSYIYNNVPASRPLM